MRRLTCKCDGENVLRELCTFDRESNTEADGCFSCGEYCEDLVKDCGNCAIQRAFNKLAEYEDLEEKGLLLKLPCKVGDTVYAITRNFISEYRIRNFICYDNGNIFFDWKCIKGIYKNVKGFHIDDIGKTVFLTKEEAEQELKRLESEQCLNVK